MTKAVPKGLEIGQKVERYVDPSDATSFVIYGKHGDALYQFLPAN
ncbi:MAG: hypothetical protein ACE5FZ_04665 [Nitrospiria bacterium]